MLLSEEVSRTRRIVAFTKSMEWRLPWEVSRGHSSRHKVNMSLWRTEPLLNDSNWKLPNTRLEKPSQVVHEPECRIPAAYRPHPQLLWNAQGSDGEGQTQDFLTEKGKPCQDLRLPLRLSACEMGSDGTPACPEHLHQQWSLCYSPPKRFWIRNLP